MTGLDGDELPLTHESSHAIMLGVRRAGDHRRAAKSRGVAA